MHYFELKHFADANVLPDMIFSSTNELISIRFSFRLKAASVFLGTLESEKFGSSACRLNFILVDTSIVASSMKCKVRF